MFPSIKLSHRILNTSLSHCSNLLDRCFLLKSLTFLKIVHTQLIKVGFNRHTFLGNRCLDLYSQVGSFNDALGVFSDIGSKNIVSWNVWLKGLLRCGRLDVARNAFDEMPERDVVSWNTVISGYASSGCLDYAFGMLREMQIVGVKPSGFTYSILMPYVCAARHGKELHGIVIRRGLDVSNVVIGNSLIDMYGKLGVFDYALGAFSRMELLDVASWNILITVCCNLGFGGQASNHFNVMRNSGYKPDEFTCSALMALCADLRNLDKGKQVFAFCVKVGFLCNSIISGATIDMLSKCNRYEDSVQLFQDLCYWDSAVCNSMISGHARHGFGEDALQLLVHMMRKDMRPTDFTLSSVLSSIPILSVEQGMQVHSLVIKLGLELDAIVASSLLEMYSKLGFIQHALCIFNRMIVKDLISWNSIIMGLTHNGRILEALDTFKKLLREGVAPDQITIAGVLLACSYGGLVEKGMTIYSEMKENFGFTPSIEHYECIVSLLCQVGGIDEVVKIIKAMPYEPNTSIWESILNACIPYVFMEVTERVAIRSIEWEPWLSLPYSVLARIYETGGRWESVVRVRKTIKKRIQNVIGCGWIGIRNHVYAFEADQLKHHGGNNTYSILRLLDWEMEDVGYFSLYQDEMRYVASIPRWDHK